MSLGKFLRKLIWRKISQRKLISFDQSHPLMNGWQKKKVEICVLVSNVITVRQLLVLSMEVMLVTFFMLSVIVYVRVNKDFAQLLSPG